MVEQTKEEIKPADRKLEMVAPEGGLPSIYTNNVGVGATSFDIRLIFGQIVDTTPEKVVVQQGVMVTMSWIEAKILNEIIGLHVKAYEEKNGTLTLAEVPASVPTPPPEFFRKK